MTGSLAERCHIRERFQRSTHLDVDLGAKEALDGYILHSSAWTVLMRVLNQVASTPQRAFTWTGPYGGGKSSLALLLAALFSPDVMVRRRARGAIGPERTRQIYELVPLGKKSWVVVPLVAKREDSVPLIAEALDRAISLRWPRKRPKSLANHLDRIDARSVISRLVAAGERAAQEGGGLLVIVDEMGKLLEHEAASTGDLQFFQELAEAFSRASGTCLFIGVLHQAFQEYATRMGKSARDEWAKVQGRFVDIPFSVDVEEVVDLVGKAIDGPRPTGAAARISKQTVEGIKEGRLSKSKELARRLNACWPLHPVTVLLLGPLSRTRFGQNERSTFSFLCSGEPSGFRDFLQSEDLESTATYTPDLLWDYLQLNLEPAILASPDGHRWAEAAEAVERARRKGDSLHVGLAKVIALLDLFGRPFGLIANEDILSACFTTYGKRKIRRALRELERWSIAAYRHHLGAWGLFGGSDIDLEVAGASARAQLGEGVAKLLPYLPVQPPIVAKRHYHETGTLRWFDARIFTSSELDNALEKLNPNAGQAGSFILVLPETGEDTQAIVGACEALSQKTPDKRYALAFGISAHSDQLRDFALEVAALERVRTTLPALEGDPVARRELHGRLNAARAALDGAIREAFETATWHIDGDAVRLSEPGGLSRLASDVSDRVFPNAPILRNELINRDKPSSNAVAARRVLMHQMVLQADRENLGIEGHPPELGIYLSLLKTTGLHQHDPDFARVWRFAEPRRAKLAESFKALWKDAEEFLSLTETERLPVSALYDRWRQPPFGLRLGVLPILAVALILAKEEELALYVDEVFTPTIDDLFVDRLLQNPADITLRRFRIAGVRRFALQRAAEVVAESLASEKLATALAIAKRLVQFVHGLHPWVKRTKRLDRATIAIRDVLLRADDPHALLFIDLSQACGLSGAIGEGAARSVVDSVFRQLRDAMAELRSAYELMLEDLVMTLASALGLPDASKASFGHLYERAERVMGASGDYRLDAFARRLQSAKEGNEWIEGLASLAANKPPRDWTDADLDRARVELAELASRFRQIEKLVLAKAREPGTLCLTGVVSDGRDPKEVDFALLASGADRKIIERATEALRSALDGAVFREDLRLAAIARLLHELLHDERQERDDSDDSHHRSIQDREVA